MRPSTVSKKVEPGVHALRRALVRRVADADALESVEELGPSVVWRRGTIAGREVVIVVLLDDPITVLDEAEVGPLLGLSPRQTAVATRLGRRMSAPAIAGDLGIRLTTVRRHIESIYLRLGVRNRDALENELRTRCLDALVRARQQSHEQIYPPLCSNSTA